MDIDPSDPDANGDVSSDCNGNFSPDECDLPHILTMLSTESENLSENFGGNVAIDGEYAFAGATGDEENGPDSGRVHVFHYDGVNWMPMQNLSASDAASGFYFGTAISVADDTAFIGASSATSGNGSFGGAVYVFKLNGGVWQETAKLTASDAQNGDSFGICLSLSDDVLAIAATRDDDLGNDSGSAYLFQRIEDAWVQVAKIKPNDGAAGDGFGQGISISDGVLAVGAPYDDDLGNGSGSVYVFEQVLGVWQQTAKIIPFNGKSFDNFGASIGLHSGGLLVGSPGDDDASAEAGAVFIYQENTTGWQQVEKLAAQPSRPGSRLGNSITCSAGLSLIGASSENVQGQASGATYLFSLSGETWHQVARLTADSPISFDHFGISVSISGNFAIVGAPTFGDGPGGSGRAFVLDLSVIGTDCAGDGRLDECDLDCNANGIADRCELLTQTSIDCNRNSILDECEITMDPDTDCNTNLVPDECELITGEPHLVNRIIATGLTSQDRFGGSFAISGDTMIVGADGDAIGSGNFYNGSAYIFERQNGNWIQRMRISASDTQSGDAFGISVAIDGDFAVVGAELEDQGGLNAGAAYIFKRMGTTWQQTQKLIAPDASSSDRFGSNVAIQGDTVFIGAPIASDSLGSEGAVYHFRRVGTDWLFDSKITASDINSCRFFGTSMSISGDSIAIGAPFSDAAVPLSGAVYIFTRISDVWLQTAKLESAEAAAIDYFGQSVALHGNLVVAGTPNKDDRGADSGAAIIFEEVNGTWTQIATLYANDEAPFDNFGRSIDILGNIVVVGSHYHDDVAYDSGAAYVFHRVGASWIQVAKLAAQNGAAGDNLGQSVRIDPYDMRILVGAWHDDGASFDSGSVCYFELDLANNDCNSDLLLDECEAISSTVPRFVAAILSESLSASDLCAFDSDHNGVLDGIDVAGLVNEMLN